VEFKNKPAIFEDLAPARGIPVNEELISIIRSKKSNDINFQHWNQRCNYIKDEDAWFNLTADNYYHSKDIVMSNDAIKALIENNIKTYLSFGSGDFNTDREIISKIKSISSYTPLDISLSILKKAILGAKELREDLKIFPIHCDFESQHDYILKELAILETPAPRLLALLGGTLANLDLGEDAFTALASKILKKNDFLLIDVGILGKNNLYEDRVNFMIKDQSTIDFWKNGWAKQVGEDDIAPRYMSELKVSFEKTTNTIIKSDSYDIFLQPENGNENLKKKVTTLKAYDSETLKHYFEKSAQVKYIVAETIPVSYDNGNKYVLRQIMLFKK
jgi:hypothetical protein